MKPFVAVGVIEMPMRIDQMLNRIALRLASASVIAVVTQYAGIDKKFSVAAGEHGNISTRTFKHTDIATKLRNSNLGGGRRVSNGNDRTFGGGAIAARHQPNAELLRPQNPGNVAVKPAGLVVFMVICFLINC